MPHVLFVCTANICRSPVAEVMLRDRFRREGLKAWTVESAAAWEIGPFRAPRFSIESMAERNLDLSAHRAKMVNAVRMSKADLVLCMGMEHVEKLRQGFPVHEAKVYLLSEMSGNAHDVEDPYGGSIDQYRRMVKEVADLIDAGLAMIIRISQIAQASVTVPIN